MNEVIFHTGHIGRRTSFILRLSGTLGLLLAVTLLLASTAAATFEQVSTFANSGEGERLVQGNSVAVNVTGAGGVDPGTVYAVAVTGASINVYSASGEFLQAWGWGVSDLRDEEYERCGPDGEPAHPTCQAEAHGRVGEGVGQLSSPMGIAVDQATGDIYVTNSSRHHGVVQIYDAHGEPIGEFGELGALQETTDQGPNKIHSLRESGLAVNEAGTVYLVDSQGAGGEGTRVMVFEPQTPGDVAHYAYTGRTNDIAATQGSTKYQPGRLALDAAGNLYTSNEEYVYEFVPGGPKTPTCEFKLSTGGIVGMTVDPSTGEPFYFNYKNKKIHQMSACNPEGKFEETASFPVTPKTENVYGMAFNPSRAFDSSRPQGMLYVIDGESHPLGGGKFESGQAHIYAPAAENSPVVESESVGSVTPTTATLNAQINPKGSQTSYVFQYLTEAEYQANEPSDRFAGATEIPLGGAELGSGQVALSASAAALGLAPDTAYRFRAIATSHCDLNDAAKVCEGIGADAVFHTFPAAAPGLPDGRVWELVSPAFKSGGEVFPVSPGNASCGTECKPGALAQRFPLQSAPDGESVVYEGQPFSTSEGALQYNEYLSKRTPSGWQTTTLAPRLMGGNLQGYRAFNASLSQGVLYQVAAPSLTPDAPSEYANLYNQQTAAPSELEPLVKNAPPNRSTGPNFQLAYAGASADFSRQFFAANDALTGPTPVAPEAGDPGQTKMNLYESSGGELHLVNVLPGNIQTVSGYFGTPAINIGNFDNSISDTSHAISDDGSRVFWSDESGQVYVRVNGETTIEIPDPAKFLSASADGSKVLLQDGHIYDLETEATTDLTGGAGGFLGMVGQSEDLSHVYFVDTAVLTGEENSHGDKAVAGQPNLYAWQEGSLAFVGTLLLEDNSVSPGGDWHFSPTQRTAQASPGGNLLAFVSHAPLTGYDNASVSCGGEGKEAPCVEVFLFDSATGELTCPSCNPTGESPLGSSSLPLMPQLGGGHLGGEDPQLPVRYLTEEGRLYFDSQDSLSPFDTNDGVEDVYQYEPSEMGTCKREAGCLDLISAGHEPIDSNFLAVDETGKNVFFTTRDQLVLKDKDELFDLYVAREGGGIAAETETARGECQGEACQQAVTPPNDPTPGSSTFEGAGNVNEQKAAKKHAKKHKKKKHSKKHHSNKRAAKHNRGGNR